ncbi:hypothetical protein AK830_g3502 [Neonectria ditissima]|uniref:Uncharacterized protein n=1 Tax=Neonectria ditissima TaxID=78410 RepID=A0A0P7BNW5_9HYPO|nr:hypothetical protein AK830_g3502 [Neonectria ditissima]
MYCDIPAWLESINAGQKRPRDPEEVTNTHQDLHRRLVHNVVGGSSSVQGHSSSRPANPWPRFPKFVDPSLIDPNLGYPVPTGPALDIRITVGAGGWGWVPEPDPFRYVDQEADPAWPARAPHQPKHREPAPARGILKGSQTMRHKKRVCFADDRLALCVASGKPMPPRGPNWELANFRFRKAKCILGRRLQAEDAEASGQEPQDGPVPCRESAARESQEDDGMFEDYDEVIEQNHEVAAANRLRYCEEAVARGSLDLSMFVHRGGSSKMERRLGRRLEMAVVNRWAVGSYDADERAFAVHGDQRAMVLPEWYANPSTSLSYAGSVCPSEDTISRCDPTNRMMATRYYYY